MKKIIIKWLIRNVGRSEILRNTFNDHEHLSIVNAFFRRSKDDTTNGEYNDKIKYTCHEIAMELSGK